MNIDRQVEELVTALMLIAGSTINVVIALRSVSPERWPRLWLCFVAATVAWCGVAIWQGYELWLIKQQLDAVAATVELVMGPVHRALIWLVFLAPSFAALVTLLWSSPGQYKRSRASA